MNFLANLATALAHSAVFFKKAEYPYEMFCEDSSAPSPTKDANRLVKALTTYLPQLSQVFNEQILPAEQAQLEASQVISPQYYDLLSNLMTTYGPDLARAGAATEAAAQEASAASNAALLSGSGGNLIRTAENLSRELNPEYYATRANTSDSINSLLGSINLDDPMIEAERLIGRENARAGTLNTPSQTNTVSNALSFGSELQKRRDALSNAINVATGFLAPAKSSFGAELALGQPKTNTGTSQFGGVIEPTNAGLNTSSQFLGGLTGLRDTGNQINANKRDWIDRVNEGFSAL